VRQKLDIGGIEVEFSNSGEGFDLTVRLPDGGHDVYLHLRPWAFLPQFTSAVCDYSWANGLTEVIDADLELMRTAAQGLLTKLEREQAYRKGGVCRLHGQYQKADRCPSCKPVRAI
jgi:hypothetical protein